MVSLDVTGRPSASFLSAGGASGGRHAQVIPLVTRISGSRITSTLSSQPASTRPPNIVADNRTAWALRIPKCTSRTSTLYETPSSIKSWLFFTANLDPLRGNPIRRGKHYGPEVRCRAVELECNVEVFSSSFFDAHYMTTDLGGAARVCEEKGLPDVQVSLDFQEAAVGVDDLGLGFQLMLASFFVLCQ